MRRALCIVALAMAAPATVWSQQLLVFPAITDELPGLHGSLWVTNVRLVAPVAGLDHEDDAVFHPLRLGRTRQSADGHYLRVEAKLGQADDLAGLGR